MYQRARAKESLHEFVRQAWPHIEGDTPFVDGWHIGVICEHLEAVTRREIRNLIVNEPPRCAKPVGKDTLVLKSTGEQVAIKDIKVGDKVLTGEGRFKKVLGKHCQGKIPTLKIKTYCHREVIAAPDHPFFTANGWLNASSLAVGDILAATSMVEDFGSEMSDEEARLLGYFIGDGCLTGGALNITACDLVEMEDIQLCCDKLGFTVNKQQYAMHKKPAHHSQTTSRLNIKKGINAPREWARGHGIAEKNSYTKRVPAKIMISNFKAIQNFLGAYFACDGSVANKNSKDNSKRTDRGISITSVSHEMIKDVQHLFMRLGIRSRIRKKVIKIKTKAQGDFYTSYILEIGSQDDVCNFIKQIPIYHSKLEKLKTLRVQRQRFDNRYMPDAIIEILDNGPEECYCLEIKDDHTFTANDLIVHNSTVVSICWPAWVWINCPSEQFLFASYAHQLSMRDSVKCRRLIESDWFKRRWGDVFHLLGDQNTKVKYENNKAGYRIATSTGASVTGFGANFLVIDDGNSAGDVQSDARRDTANSWLDGVWSTRLNDPKRDCRVIIQQRLHENDMTGHILKNDTDKNWTHLCLPMEYVGARKCKTIMLPSTKGKVWEDPREIDGELLWPQRIGPKELQKLKNDLGSQYAISGQLQQSPSPDKGGILQADYFKWYKFNRPPKLDNVIMSLDTAFGEREEGAYSAATIWGLFQDENKVYNLILLSMWRARCEYPDLRKQIIRMTADYRDDNPESTIKPDGHHEVDRILVEAKASGLSLIQDLSRAGLPVIRFDPTKFGDKIQRVRLITHFLEVGRVWVPARGPDYTKLRAFADIFVNQMLLFPRGDSRDLVDTLTQILLYLSRSGWIAHESEHQAASSNGNTNDQKTAPFY